MLSLAAILTHDLSNPLQSITVLCELGMEEDDPDDAPRRAQQSLQAAERMRDLLHAYAALVRTADRPTKLAGAIERTTAMFARRCERHRIALRTIVERDFEGPACTGLSVVALYLAMIRTAEANRGPFEARLVVDGGELRVSLLDQDGLASQWPTAAVDSIAHVVANDGKVSFDGTTLHIQLETKAP